MRLAPFLFAGVLLTSSTFAWADDHAVATELFNAGRDLMTRGEYALACPKLAESARLDPTVGALAKLGACLEHQGRLVGARAAWQQALNLARANGDAREADVLAELTRVDHAVPKLSLAATGAIPAGAIVRVDDLELGAGSIGVSLPVEPGEHRITVSAPERKVWSTVVRAEADGATTTVTIPQLDLAPPLAAPAVVAPAPGSSAPVVAASPAAARDASMPPLRVAALITGGAGVVTLGAATVLGLTAMARKSDASCPDNVCVDSGHASTLEGAKSLANESTIAFVAGGALVAGAAALWIFAPSAAVKVGALRVSPSVGGVVVGGVWE